jgi:hypothetical protein
LWNRDFPKYEQPPIVASAPPSGRFGDKAVSPKCHLKIRARDRHRPAFAFAALARGAHSNTGYEARSRSPALERAKARANPGNARAAGTAPAFAFAALARCAHSNTGQHPRPAHEFPAEKSPNSTVSSDGSASTTMPNCTPFGLVRIPLSPYADAALSFPAAPSPASFGPGNPWRRFS